MFFNIRKALSRKAARTQTMIEFYNVKTRSKVQVPEADVRKVVYQTKTGARYGLKAIHEGSTMTKFINRETYDTLNVPSA